MAIHVAKSEMVHGLRLASTGSLLKPMNGLLVVFCNSSAVAEADSKIVLRNSLALLSCEQEQLHRLQLVVGISVCALVTAPPNVRLSVRMPLLCGL